MAKLMAFRVDDELAMRIKQRAIAKDMPVSEFVRRAVEQALAEAPEPSPYESIKHLIGTYGSGRSDLSQNHSKILKEKLRAKHSR